jgi:hypothetical protein
MIGSVIDEAVKVLFARLCGTSIHADACLSAGYFANSLMNGDSVPALQ